MVPHPVCLFIRQRNASPKGARVPPLKLLKSPDIPKHAPLCLPLWGGDFEWVWCLLVCVVISRRHNQDQGWGKHFFNSKWFNRLASEDRGRLPLGKPLIKREFNMSELWISYDFKDEQILNTLGVSACPDVLQNSQTLEIVFHHF